MIRGLTYGLVTLILAAIVHIAAVWALPYVIMDRVGSRIAGEIGGVNRPGFPPPANDRSRQVVMPSPDLLYTACVFDLDHGPLRVRAEVPHTYWSVAFYAANSDNFLTLNDRALPDRKLNILLMAPDAVITGGSARIVHAPSRRGIVLFRTLLLDPTDLPRLDAARRTMTCATVK